VSPRASSSKPSWVIGYFAGLLILDVAVDLDLSQL
jgi:hypothetical protein